MAEWLRRGLQNLVHGFESRPCLHFLNMTDVEYLQQAQEIAKQSQEDVPCGCVLVDRKGVITAQFNSQNSDNIAINHAEIKALVAANYSLKKRKLPGTTAYCSCEPCAMCLTALSYANIERIVYATPFKTAFPNDAQAVFDAQKFIKGLNFVPKLEHILL